MREESLRQASLPCKPLKCEIYDEEFYPVESTGAKVTLSSSVSLIHFYCSRLPSDGYFKPHPRFVIDKDSNIFSLYMPKSCPVQNISVEGESNKLKEIASLEIIKKLHQIGALSDYLLPVSDDKAELDSEESGFEYNSEQISYYPGELGYSWSSYSCYGLYHCYKVTLNKHFQSEYSFRDIILVVKSDLGLDLISYSFDLEEDSRIVFVNVKYAGRVHLNREHLVQQSMKEAHISAVIFDLYGTLLDTETLHKNLFIEFLEKYGKIVDSEKEEKRVGQSMKDFAISVVSDYGCMKEEKRVGQSMSWLIVCVLCNGCMLNYDT